MQDNQKIIDLEVGLSRIRGNRKLYKKMLQMFLNSKEFETIESQITAGDLKGAFNTAHAIKGMSANLAMMPLSDASSTLMVEFSESVADDAHITIYRQVLEKTMQAAHTLIGTIED